MHLVFDLDGTIMDSAEGIINALNHTLVAFGEEPRDPQSLTRFVGPSLKQIFAEVLNTSCATAIDEAIVTYREYYFTRGYQESRPYPGIEQTLSCLQEKTRTMRICTARRRDIATTIIKHFGLDAFFDDIHGCDLDGTKTEIIKSLLADGTIERRS
ncbi:HAD hydrolase-like protein [Candidatus Sumerlaeota bacterium]